MNEKTPNEQLAKKVKTTPAYFADDKVMLEMNPIGKAFYKRYINSAIAMDFLFDVTVENKVSATLDPIAAITGGMVKVGMTGSGDFMRQNQRSFVFSATFKDLLLLNGCDPSKDQVATGRDYAYPIAGEIGLFELISTFVDLNQGFGLASNKETGLSKDDVTPVFADSLNFTTTLMGSVSPQITLGPAMPVSHGLRLLDSSLMASGTRTDHHNVVIGLVMPSSESAPKAPSLVTPVLAIGAPAAKATPEHAAKQSAISAAYELRLKLYITRISTVGP